MTTTPVENKFIARPAHGLRKVRQRTATADAHQPVLWRSILSQSAVAAIAVVVGLFLNVTVGTVALAALSTIVLGILTYNLIFWKRSKAVWASYSSAKKSYVNTRRGTPMEETFARASMVQRTNAACLGIYLAALVAVILFG